jgi:hypothetical protein
MQISKYVAITALAAGSFYAGMRYTPSQPYEAFEENHEWFLRTPDCTKPIYENDQVGTVEDRMRGLLVEDLSVLNFALSKIRQDSKDISEID